MNARVITPDYVYDQYDWEFTYPIEDIQMLTDAAPKYEVSKFSTLVSGPDIYAAYDKWFYTEQEAEDYAEKMREKDEED